ncbi:MAG: hypothetical protein K1X29_08385 [Bdellovibrionales bacterium]|nr:hypothetical protein [Bdellovibrionales bacterium]
MTKHKKFIFIFFFGIQTFAFSQNNESNRFKSAVDELLTIRSISVLGFTDNLQGIYARPLESHLTELLGKNHHWDLLPVNLVGPLFSPEELEEDVEKSKSIAASLSADAFFVSRISKGPQGVYIILSLFLKQDGQLLFSESFKDDSQFEISDLKIEIEKLLKKILNKIPYQGRILSREGQRVTLNMGANDGLQSGQVLSVVQIIDMKRHPKFHFLISTEKEVLGKVKILKIDETLSFGSILTERERGVIQKNAKILTSDFVSYSAETTLDDNKEDDFIQRPESKMSFGENPQSWVPTPQPTFGQVGARIGNSIYSTNTTLQSVGSLESSTYLAPSVILDGEIWITNHISFHTSFKQGLMQVKNPRSGSSPSKLNQSLTSYDFLFGYNFRLSPSIWGPNLEVLLGYLSSRSYVDNASPQVYTTTNYTGVKTGIRGDFPILAEQKWFAGAQIYMVLQPKLSETPVSSGSSSQTTINNFGLYAFKKLSERTKLTVSLDFEQYSNNFSGTGTRAEPATSSSQRLTTMSCGLNYLF